jgi:replicative DNA helicase
MQNSTINYLSASVLFGKAMEELQFAAPAVKFSNKFSRLNEITGGLRPREFTILCGATGVGKTTLLANLSADLLIQEVPHFVASVETGHSDYVKRILCALTGQDINDGDPVNEALLFRLYEENKKYFLNDKLFLSLYENRFSVETLIENIQYMHETYGCKVAFIDNLNFFLEVTSAQNSIIEMDRVIHELIIFCKTCDIHIVMVMHPKKTDSGRVESEFDIKGSSTAVQEAHNVFLFNRVSEDLIPDFAQKGDRELKIAKMRRRGKYVHRSLVFTGNPVSYQERTIVRPQ